MAGGLTLPELLREIPFGTHLIMGRYQYPLEGGNFIGTGDVRYADAGGRDANVDIFSFRISATGRIMDAEIARAAPYYLIEKYERVIEKIGKRER